MEYHSDRFEDHSLLLFKGDKLKAVFPANRKGDSIYSHQGLTYGGLLSHSNSISEVEDLFKSLLEYLKQEGFSHMHTKVAPYFMASPYSSALEYFLVQNGAQITRRDLNYVLDLRNEVKLHKSKRKKLAALDTTRLEIKETQDLAPFWNDLLKPVLNDRYDSKPVHTLEEIENLKGNFPNHIVQYDVWLEDSIIAGMTLFLNGKVVKSQYGAATELGKEYRALDWLYVQLFNEYKEKGFTHFDMGSTNISGGSDYNKGLSKYKEEFGALPTNLDTYILSL